MAGEIKALYTASFAPNPQIVDIFAREKGLDVDKLSVQVNILAADNRSGDLLKKNPAGQLPFFELNDGSCIAETIAMCEYLEEIQPAPPLFGKTPAERANARMWQRRMEEHFHYPCFTAFRFWTASDDCKGDFKDFFKGKAPVRSAPHRARTLAHAPRASALQPSLTVHWRTLSLADPPHRC